MGTLRQQRRLDKDVARRVHRRVHPGLVRPCWPIALALVASSFIFGATPVQSAGHPFNTGDTWSMCGLVSYKTSLKKGGNPKQHESDAFFFVVETKVEDVSEETVALVHVVKRYPAQAQLWSEKKIADTAPLARGLVPQRFGLHGPRAGLPEPQSTFLTPVVTDCFIPLLLPRFLEVGETYTYAVPVRNPLRLEETGWDATLTITVVSLDGVLATVEYQHTAAPQSRKVAGNTLRHKMKSEGTMVLDTERKRVVHRSGEQATESAVDNGSTVLRTEEVVFTMWSMR